MPRTMQPGDWVAMSWGEYEALGPDARGEYNATVALAPDHLAD